ncbi:MAG: alpha/beta fold hydrolase [Rhizobacter sp.]
MGPFPFRRTALVGAETLEYVLAGQGPARVVLIGGAGAPIEGWHKVFDGIASFATVLAYNRPGLGGSSAPAAPQTGLHLVGSLRGLLQSAGVAPPWVLVAHSFGGLIANLLARHHPDEVAAVVMVEATAPDDPFTMARHENRLQRGLKALLDRLLPQHPANEVRHVATTVAQLQAAPPFPAVPLTVITGQAPAMAWATPAEALRLRAMHQRSLATLSPHGRQVLAHRSGHFPQFSEPALLIAEVREAIEAAAARPAR